MKKIFKYFLILAFSAGLTTACDLDIAPSDSLTGAQMTASPTGLTDILNGCYAIMKDYAGSNNGYIRQYYQMADFSSDDIVYGHATTDELNMIFRYEERHPGLSNVGSFWAQSYKIIYSTNVAIDVISAIEDPSDDELCLMGEALFLKAFCMHCLVRLYCNPYDPASASKDLGLVIRENGSDAQPKARATVQETYDYILDCLLSAESLMAVGSERSSDRCYASVGAVRALLSRVYLYMQNWDKCIEYSTKVIQDGNYAICDAESFGTYFTQTWTNKESIWVLRFLPQDDLQSAAVASMIYKAEGCWGEEGYSEPLLQDMGKGTGAADDDVRWSFTCPVNTKNGLDLIPCSKLSNQDGKPTLFSPPLLRISEMYFNRAEANANKNNINDALNDINTVRGNRMLANAEEHLYTSSDIETNMVDLVLKEKRNEFAFEGHRFFDLMRNKKDIIRDYWGYHTNYTAGQATTSKPSSSLPGIVTKYTDPRLVFPIPTQEIDNNPECVQNPGY